MTFFPKKQTECGKSTKKKKANKNLIHAYEPKEIRPKDTAKVNKTNTNPKRVKKEKKKENQKLRHTSKSKDETRTKDGYVISGEPFQKGADTFTTLLSV